MANISPEVQKQLDEQKQNCPFCKIVKGEIESKKVYEDDKLLGILDIYPKVNGHMLLLPKEHYPILPFLPPETFKHTFSLMPKIISAVKSAMVVTGADVMIANGGVAGQQSPHFLIHILPRESGDKYDLFEFSKAKEIDKKKIQEANELLTKQVPAIISSFLARNPVSWRTGKIKTAPYLEGFKKEKIYEDEKVLIVLNPQPQAAGHLTVYSQEQQHDFEKLDKDAGLHMFSAASFCASAVYEGLKAHGSNIILKTGMSLDNPDGRLSVHVLPRFQDDGLDFSGKPLEKKQDLDSVKSRLKDKLFAVEHSMKKKEKPVIINLDERPIKKINQEKIKHGHDSPSDEILEAIQGLMTK